MMFCEGSLIRLLSLGIFVPATNFPLRSQYFLYACNKHARHFASHTIAFRGIVNYILVF